MKRTLVLTLVLLSLPFGQAHATKLWEEGWSFSPVAGISLPGLSIIYDKAFVAPFVGQSEITVDLPDDAEGENAFPIENFLIENSLPKPSFAPEAGVEFTRNFGTKNDFYIGISTWEIGSSGLVSTILPLQGGMDNEAYYERRAKFSYTQYFLGWRHYFLQRKRRLNLYTNIGLHEIFDIDYKETHVFEFISGPPTGFKRVITYQTQATGILMAQLGLGLELRMGDRFSFSFESGYAFGVNQGNLKGLDVRSDFNEGDRLSTVPEPISLDRATNDVYVLAPDGESREKMVLDLNGWRFVAKLNVAF